MDSGKEPLAFFDRRVAPALGVAAAVILFGLMALTCLDVVGRYFFNQPIYGGFEITEMMLAGLIFCGLPLVTLRNDHVTVDLFDAITPDWVYRLQHIFACLVSFVSTAYLAWQLWARAVAMNNAGETTAQLKLNISYLTYAMSILMGLTALALLVLALRRVPRQHSAEI
jgi:TRAP-type C4-dicarboxylate transport system permease small subunit